MTTALQKVGAGAATMAGAVGGALAGGPIGLAIGAGGGLAVDLIRARMGKHPAAAVPPVVQAALAQPPTPTIGLPATADKAAAASAVHMMLLGNQAEVAPAKSWLQKFQATVGLPATGALDPTTRSLLILATAGGTYDASHLPATTILG